MSEKYFRKEECIKFLEKMGEHPSKVYITCYAAEYREQALSDKLHLDYLKDHGLCKVETNDIDNVSREIILNDKLARPLDVPPGSKWFISARITSKGISKLEVARKTGKPPKIDEADEILKGLARVKQFLLTYIDEFSKAVIRTMVPALLAGIGAGLSFGWFNKLIH